jgi:hypothetical protein
MRIEYLYRYPVKGLTAEALESAEVEQGDCIPWHRATPGSIPTSHNGCRRRTSCA